MVCQGVQIGVSVGELIASFLGGQGFRRLNDAYYYAVIRRLEQTHTHLEN